MEFFPVGESATEVYPGSSMIRTGDYLWLAGASAYNENLELVGEGDLEVQIRETLANIRRTLARAGCDFSSIIRMTHYFTVPLNLDLIKSYWDIRRELFGNHRPVTTGMQVAGLSEPAQLFEIDVIAYAPQDSHQK